MRRAIGSALVAYVSARAAERLPEPTVRGWQRTNFRGRSVTLSTGRAAAVGLSAALISDPVALVAISAAAGAGAFDDLRAPDEEAASDKGLSGHLEAARAGRISGGVVKVAVIGSGAVVAAWLASPSRSRGDVLTRAALIAGTANLVNLFDLRPGRAAKLALVVGALGLGATDGRAAQASGAVVGTALAVLPADLQEVGMLGDLGANALGAVLGLRLGALPGRWRLVALVKVLALTLLSERVSFSHVIESVPLLRRLDQLGRT